MVEQRIIDLINKIIDKHSQLDVTFIDLLYHILKLNNEARLALWIWSLLQLWWLNKLNNNNLR